MKKTLLLLLIGLASLARAYNTEDHVFAAPDRYAALANDTANNYALSSALTATSSSWINLSGWGGFFLYTTGTSTLVEIDFTGQTIGAAANAVWTQTLNGPVSQFVNKAGMWARIRNSRLNAPTTTMTAYYHFAITPSDPQISGGNLSITAGTATIGNVGVTNTVNVNILAASVVQPVSLSNTTSTPFYTQGVAGSSANAVSVIATSVLQPVSLSNTASTPLFNSISDATGNSVAVVLGAMPFNSANKAIPVNANLNGVNGAALSVSNPIFVTPATGAGFSALQNGVANSSTTPFYHALVDSSGNSAAVVIGNMPFNSANKATLVNANINGANGAALSSSNPIFISAGAGTTFNFWPTTAAYSAATVAAFAPPNAIGDRWTFENRGTNVCFITYMDFTSRASTSATRTIQLARRSTYDTGGTAVTVTNTAIDTTSAASGVTVKQWTTQPADGTFVGNIWAAQYDDMQITSGNGQSQIRQYNFVQNGESPIVVRPGESLALHDMNGTNAAAEWTVSVKWSEGRNN